MTQLQTDTRTCIILALLAAAALILRMAETLLPTAGVPGIKPGLANAVTLICLCLFNFRLTVLYLAVRLMLTALFITGLFTPSFFIGAAGAVLSLLVMQAALQTQLFSLPGVSIAGACAHNTGQLLTAAVLMDSAAVFALWPLLMALSVPFGLITGFIAQKAVPHLKILCR